jgi:RimJ/RimL family protein N-acetyltransferase
VRFVEVRALTAADAPTIARWRYPAPYATYDVDDDKVLARDHWAVTQDGALVGYCCFGAPARVPGAVAMPETLDVGYGLAPELMRRGLGVRFVRAVLAFATTELGGRRFRLYILEWNGRSRAVAERLGFELDGVLENDDGRFVVMTRDDGHSS